MVGAGAKNFEMVEPEPEIWVPVPQAQIRFLRGSELYK